MTDLRRRYGEWAVITGASSGIGEAFAHAVAARGLRPILVARRAAELERVAADIAREHGAVCDTVPLDLADPGFIAALEEHCRGRDLGLIVGNAAFNPAGAFPAMSRETLLRMIDVNDRANVLLANAFLPGMLGRGRGAMLLVGSTEGFMGVPFSACYSATKAFLLSFGEALWGECEGTGVDVLVLMPGATDTPLLATRNLGGRKVAAMAPREVAEIGLDNLANGPFVVPGRANRRAAFIMRSAPRRWMVRKIGSAVRRIVMASAPPPSAV